MSPCSGISADSSAKVKSAHGTAWRAAFLKLSGHIGNSQTLMRAVKPSQYFRAAASLSSALIAKFGTAFSLRRHRTLEVFLEVHRDPVAFVGNCHLHYLTIFVLERLVD
jgi:hypothetical protein